MTETFIICLISFACGVMNYVLYAVYRQKAALLKAEIERLRDELAWYRATGGWGTNTVGEPLPKKETP